MIDEFLDFISNINLFDIFVIIIFIYNIFQCFFKGFSLSLISFSKWILSTIITIILVPKLQPLTNDYIQSEFVNNVGLGIVIFILTLFITIVIGKTLSKAVTWTGVGSIDKIFGFLFGFIFNYIIFSTVIYGINNFEFLNNLENFLLENSFLLQELNTFNNNLLTNIFYNENLNSD